MLTMLKAQGLPAVIGITQGLERISPTKLARDLRSYGQRFFYTEFTADIKLADANSGVQLARALTSAPVKPVHWRAQRSHFVAEHIQAEASTDGGATSNLKMRG